MILLHDLDDLTLQVRSTDTRTYVSECVRALRAGALRAAVLSLWVAVNSDIIDKIRELAASGDAQATADITQLEGWIQTNNLSRLQVFERTILKLAHDQYEFLSAIELEHLQRLQLDRNRCAHPALTPDGRLFEPLPEQVRAHLVYAAHSLFAQPPVQGRSALDRLKADLAGQTFPTDAGRVADYLGPKYLERGKASLVDNIVKAVLKEALAPSPAISRVRALHTLAAVHSRRFDLYWAVMTREWPGRVSRAEEGQLPLILSLLASDPPLWTLVQPADQVRIETLVDKAPDAQAQDVLFPALRVHALDHRARVRLRVLPADVLAPLIMSSSAPELAVVAVERLECARTFREGWQFLDAVQAVIDHLSESDLRRVVVAIRTNDQIHSPGNIPQRVNTLFSTTIARWPALAPEWTALIKAHGRFTQVRRELQKRGLMAPEVPDPTAEGVPSDP